ncbi:hypothetical protein GGF43_002986 [Coemansia sp. RSA 2618]|nr:hypothetical protein GGF43_002986 [Coemansia sp. RSA 2618]
MDSTEQHNSEPQQAAAGDEQRPASTNNSRRRKKAAAHHSDEAIKSDSLSGPTKPKQAQKQKKRAAAEATNWRVRDPATQPSTQQAMGSATPDAPAAKPLHTVQAPPRRRLFDKHYPPTKVTEHIRNGYLVRGVLRINPKSPTDAYVSLDETPSAQAQQRFPELQNYVVGSSSDIYICGNANRNRAISGDVVAVRILSQKEAGRVYRNIRAGNDRRVDKIQARRRARLESMADGVHAVSGETPSSDVTQDSVSESTAMSDSGPRVPEVFGAIVAIIAPNANRTFVGTLSERLPAQNNPQSNNKQFPRDSLCFRPLDKAVPLMAVPKDSISDIPHAKDICAVHMGAWDATSLYPMGAFVKNLGQRGSIEIETELILEENGVSTEPFPPNVLRCLPKTPWRIPPVELKRRTDLRSACVFTIDPPTARDLDDAVSCQLLPNGNVLIGVHIADVSYFVRPRTALDGIAQQRATTTYMVQRAYPMLPSVLCEDLCSLNPGVDRLAFSVMWEIEPSSATVCSTWFGRTVINSACKLSYDDAQHIIDGGHLNDSLACFEHTGVRAAPGLQQRRADIESSVLWFYSLSLIMRKRRFDEGALSLHSVRLSFDLDSNGLPMGCQPYSIKDSNRLIEEFMLLANMSVAARIEACFPNAALLRRHSPPLERRLDEVCRQLGHSGIDLDTQSAGAISHSIQDIDDPDIRYTVEEMLIVPMQRAAYFSTHAVADRNEYRHYALNAPLYTHFTSPIRRYADVVVHRMLEASLAVYGNHVAADHPLLPAYYSPYFPHTAAAGSLTTSVNDAFALLIPKSEAIAGIAHQCNLRKDAAKKAQESSSTLFLVNYLTAAALHMDTPGVITQAVITKVRENGISFVTPMFGIDGIIYMDRMADKKDQVVSTDGRKWKLSLWSVEPASVTLVWKATPQPPAKPKTPASEEQLADMLSALVIDDVNHSIVELDRNSSAETLTQTLCVFDKISVCIIPETSPPSLTVKLALPYINS